MYRLIITENWLDDNCDTTSIVLDDYLHTASTAKLFVNQGYHVVIVKEE